MKTKFRYARPVSELSAAEREMEIERLERERMKIVFEIDALVKSYCRAIGDGTAMRGARRLGKSPNDWSYWHKQI